MVGVRGALAGGLYSIVQVNHVQHRDSRRTELAYCTNPNPILKIMARTKVVPKRRHAQGEEETTRYSLVGATNIIKNQLKSDQIKGVWYVEKNEEFNVTTNIFKMNDKKHKPQVQMRITGSIITIITSARHSAAITETVKMHAQRATPKKQKTEKEKGVPSQGSLSKRSNAAAGTPRASRSSPRQNLDAEAANARFMKTLDQSTLSVHDERWLFKSQQFVKAVRRTYADSAEIIIAHDGQCMAILAKMRVKREPKRAVMNYWPVSGAFTLTGIKAIRDGAPYEFFHTTIKNGPDFYDDHDDDHDHEDNPDAYTQMDHQEIVDVEDGEVPAVEQAQGTEAAIDKGGLDLIGDAEVEEAGLDAKIKVVAEDVDDADPGSAPDGGAMNLDTKAEGPHAHFGITEIGGPHAHFVRYLSKQLIEEVVKTIRGDAKIVEFKKIHAQSCIRKIMLEQYISRTTMAPCPATSIVTSFLREMKLVSAPKIFKWLETSAKKWEAKAKTMTESIDPDESIFGDSCSMMIHMRTIIATSTQTIAGLSSRVEALASQVAGQQKAIKQLQTATANRVPKGATTPQKDKAATKKELVDAVRDLKGLFSTRKAGNEEELKNEVMAEVRYGTNQINALKKTIQGTQEYADAEHLKRIELQRVQLKGNERIRALEALQETGPEISDELIRAIRLKMAPEISIMIAEAVDKIMEAKPKGTPGAQRSITFQNETPLALGFEPSPKRAKVDDRQAGRARSSHTGDRGHRGGGGVNSSNSSNSGPTSSSNSTSNRAGNGKGSKGKGGNRSNSQHEPTLQLVEPEATTYDFNLQAPKPMPSPRWTYVAKQYEAVERALVFAGLTEGRGGNLDNDTAHTYLSIRTGAFSAQALQRMIIKSITAQEGPGPNNGRVDHAVTELVKYLELLEKQNGCPARTGSGNIRN